MIELRQLRYFVALAELRNFSRVAERELVSQSAVSQQISRLERSLGLRLFSRTTHMTRLTSDGASLLPRAQQILSQLSALERSAEVLTRQSTGALRLGSPINAAKCASRQQLVEEFIRIHAGVDVSIEIGWSEDLIRKLRGQELDLSFVNFSFLDARPEVLPADLDDLEFRLVQDAPSAFVVPERQLPLIADRTGFKSLPLLVYPERLNRWYHHEVLSIVEKLGAQPVLLRDPSLPGILEEVRSGRGIFPAIPWEVSGLDESSLDGIVITKMPASPFRSNLWLARRRGDHQRNVEEFFRTADHRTEPYSVVC